MPTRLPRYPALPRLCHFPSQVVQLVELKFTSQGSNPNTKAIMPLKSDLSISAAKFDPTNASAESKIFNEKLMAISGGGPKWWDVGAAKYREMRLQGKTAFPPPTLNPEALNVMIPSRDSGRNISCRLMYPSSRKTDSERKGCKGVVMHIHGGGWVLGDENSTDALLKLYADTGDLAVVSVGYRLAPEDPFPKGVQDCIDAAEYLVKSSDKEYGGPLSFIGGESAGGHLTLLTIFHLLKTNPSFILPGGLLLHFGCYDMTKLPSVTNFHKDLILSHNTIDKFTKAFLPNHSLEQMKDASVSPIYENLEPLRGRLPSALFTIGTEDPLVDDSVNMSMRWLQAGGDTILKVYAGAPHGFIAFPRNASKEAGQCLDDTAVYIKDCMAKQ